jgi:D-alanyl-lipoteichoic acid acyltransferase DltB (MBOAT superfamily)
MFVSGFWHGAYMSIFIWGAMHGLYLAFEQIAREYIPRFRQKEPSRKPLSIIWVYCLVILAWIPFKASSLGTAIRYFRQLAPPFSFHLSWTFLPALVPIAVSFFFDWQEEKRGDNAFFTNWRSASQTAGIVMSLLIMLILFLIQTGTAVKVPEFIYQGF